MVLIKITASLASKLRGEVPDYRAEIRTIKAYDAGDTTWYRERLSACSAYVEPLSKADPVASSSNAEPSQRALRGGSASAGLRYVLILWETRPLQ